MEIAFEEEVRAMARNYRKYDEDFRQGAVQLVFETGKPIAQVARELGQRRHAGQRVCQGPAVRLGRGTAS